MPEPTDDEALSFLILAGLDLKVAGLIEAAAPLQAMFSLQQAAEKMLKAVLSAEGLPYPKIHLIGEIAARLPRDHLWRSRLADFDRLTPAATTLRYPTQDGGVPPAPPRTVLRADRVTLESYLTELEPWIRAKLAA